jgi:hypothetical protein
MVISLGEITMFAKPYRLLLDRGQLTKRRLQASAKRVLVAVHRGYKADTDAWIDVFAPKDTGNLAANMKASTQEGFVFIDANRVGINLRLASLEPYSRRVNKLNPPVNWTNQLTIYHFFDVIVREINNTIIPNRVAAETANEGLT